MTDRVEEFENLCRMMFKGNPGDHFHQLGVDVLAAGKGWFKLFMDCKPELIGNPETGVIHGGPITALLDTCCGFAASSALDKPSICPTIDLRIDYMRPAEPNQRVFAEAEAYRVTRNVVFTRGKAYQDDPDNPVAYCVGNFARLDKTASKMINEHVKQAVQQGDAQ
jgi:uncharacterized protein (TIGR00369 family)